MKTFALILSLLGQDYVVDHDLSRSDCAAARAGYEAMSVEHDAPTQTVAPQEKMRGLLRNYISPKAVWRCQAETTQSE